MKEDDEVMESNENDNSSDSSSEDEQQVLEKRVGELEIQLSNNKYLYDVYVELVDLYEKAADLDSLRDVYMRFHMCFPLTSELWLKWIKTEMKVATSDLEKRHIYELFDKAVEDYLSVNLWLEYAQYAMDVGGIERTRRVLEKGLNAVGLHTSEGSLLWDFMREIEMASLSVASKESDAWKEQALKVIEIFRRQLSVPLLGMENTYLEWKEWKDSLPSDFAFDPQPVEWGYQKALKLLETYKPHEDELVVSQFEADTYLIYKKYISIVKDPSTVICLYERAVAQLCLNAELWQDYCDYTFKLGDIALKTCDRSLKNCPWVEELWVTKLRILENMNKEQSVILSVLEQALSDVRPSLGLQLWFTYIEFLRRNSNDKNKLYKVLATASDQVGEQDSISTLDRFHARLLAKDGRLKEAMEIWNGIFEKTPNKTNLTFWLEYIALIKQFGSEEPNRVRSVYKKAIASGSSSCADFGRFISEEWLLYEREHGTLEDVLKCAQACKTSIRTYDQVIQEHDARVEKVISGGRVPVVKSRKRKHEQDHETTIKKVKQEVKQMNIDTKTRMEKHPTRTVFISNINHKVDENSLKTMFPNAEAVEVCRNKNGSSKCFAFVQFALEEEAMTALARDREPLDGRPVFISTCKTDKAEREAVPKKKFSTEMEENKLFVRGLPKTLTDEEIMKIFEPYGATDVRIVYERNGKPKGFGYVEFPDAEAAKKAIEATNGMEVAGRAIVVAISAPPRKKAPDEKAAEPIRHARSRLQVPLIPRALQVTGEKENGQSVAPKSNDDFRKMLLNK